MGGPVYGIRRNRGRLALQCSLHRVKLQSFSQARGTQPLTGSSIRIEDGVSPGARVRQKVVAPVSLERTTRLSRVWSATIRGQAVAGDDVLPRASAPRCTER